MTSQISIRGRVAEVFDLITTTGYWPLWHPATISIGGVIERPMALGDAITECGRIDDQIYDPTWTVTNTEHKPAKRIVLSSSKGRVQIGYAFGGDGRSVGFTRTVTFQLEAFRRVADLSSLMRALLEQSNEALRRLKALVESSLAAPAANSGYMT